MKVDTYQEAKPGSTKKSFWGSLLKHKDASVVLATIILFIIFTIGSSSFLTSYNMFNIFRSTSLYFFIGLGQAIAIIVGGMNISLGAIGGLSVVGAGLMMHTLGLSPWMAIIFSLILGGIAGLTNAILILKLKLNSFIVTLATSFVFTGLVMGVSKGYPYTDIPASFTFIGRQGLLGIPYLFYLMLLALIILWFVFKYTVTGRQLLATGGNIDAARMSGIKTNLMIVLANVLSGLFAATAGLLWVSRMGSATPATGSDWLIISFAVAVIGGTALGGGAISAIGLLASSLMIVLIKNGLIMLDVNVYYEQTFLGLIILFAVAFESIRSKYSGSGG